MTTLGIDSSSRDVETFFEQSPSHPTVEVSPWVEKADEIFRIQDDVLTSRENHWISREWSAALLDASILLGKAGTLAERGEDPTDTLNEALCKLLDVERQDLIQWQRDALYKLTDEEYGEVDPKWDRPY